MLGNESGKATSLVGWAQRPSHRVVDHGLNLGTDKACKTHLALGGGESVRLRGRLRSFLQKSPSRHAGGRSLEWELPSCRPWMSIGAACSSCPSPMPRFARRLMVGLTGQAKKSAASSWSLINESEISSHSSPEENAMLREGGRKPKNLSN